MSSDPLRFKIERRSNPESREPLTGDEAKWIATFHTCPDCVEGSLLAGPRHDLYQNALCESCDSEFNLGPIVSDAQGLTIFGAHRNGKANAERRKCFAPYCVDFGDNGC